MRAALPRPAVQCQRWPGGEAGLRHFNLQPWGLKTRLHQVRCVAMAKGNGTATAAS